MCPCKIFMSEGVLYVSIKNCLLDEGCNLFSVSLKGNKQAPNQLNAQGIGWNRGLRR